MLARCTAIHTKYKINFVLSAFLQVGVRRQASHAFAVLKFRWVKESPPELRTCFRNHIAT
ncbi:hypothetical protein AC231_13130 [Clostridium pasteurianum]|nr:hypothetical protein AQ983_04370 [Clostridium pasteurianum DSM 525 = ATCC 6013]OMH21439.1 hypothetical protein AC231_13130 [Clostridium pasteurianum]